MNSSKNTGGAAGSGSRKSGSHHRRQYMAAKVEGSETRSGKGGWKRVKSL